LTSNEKVGPPAPHLLETEVDGDVSLYDPTTESVTILNGTASDVWALCDGEHTVEEVTTLLAASYGTTESAIAEDVEKTIRRLRDSGLLSQ
jgi:hypothetical protein